MTNENFDSQNKQNDRKEFRHLPQDGNSDPRRYNQDDYDYRSRPRKTSNGTTIALAVVTSLFMCVVGYEIVRINYFSEAFTDVRPQTKHKPILVDFPGVSNGFNSLSTALESDHEDYHLNILKEQNKQQAAKIKNLRAELLEKMQQVHDIRANLFKYDGEPGDKSKISDLQQEITTKLKYNDQLKLKIQALENDSTDLEKKITQLEVTRDTLMGMIENQQMANGYEIANLKHQINDLQKGAKVDKGDLDRKVQSLELTQLHLTESLEKKTLAIEGLENELASHQQLLTYKSTELEKLLNDHTLTKNEIRYDTLDLIANIEFELTAKEIAKKEFLAALDEKAFLITQLENEIIQHQSTIEKNGSLLKDQAEISNKKSMDLLIALEFEALHTQHLQQEYGKSAQLYADQLSEKESKIKALQDAISLKSSEVSFADEQIHGLSNVYATERQESETQLQGLAASHEIESLKVHLFHNHLQNALAKIEQLENIQEELQNAASSSLQHNDQLSRQLALKEQQVADHQLQLQVLFNSHHEGREQSGEQAINLADLIELERLQSNQLAIELAAAQQKYTSQEEIANLLGTRLDGIVHEAELLEKALSLSQALLDEKELEISKVNDDKNIAAEDAKTLKQKYEQNTADLIAQLQELTSEHENSQHQARRLADVIETERLHNQRLNEELAAASTKHAEHEEIAAQLDARIEEINHEGRILEEALLASKALLEEKEHELYYLSSDKSATELHLNSLRQAHESKLADHASEILSLSDAHEEAKLQARLLADVIETERLHNQRLTEELAEAKERHLSHEQIATELDAKLEEISKESIALEDALMTSKALLEEKENELNLLRDNKLSSEQYINSLKLTHESNLADQTSEMRAYAAANEESQLQARLLADVIETERLHNQRITEELAEAKERLLSHEQIAGGLDAKLEETSRESIALEDALMTSKALLDEKENELNLLRDNKLSSEQYIHSLKLTHESNLADQTSEMRAFAAANEESQLQARLLADVIETERLHNQRLTEELAEAKKNHVSQQEIANELETKLEEISKETIQLEDALIASKSLLDARENELELLKENKSEIEQNIGSLKQTHESQVAEHAAELRALTALNEESQLQARLLADVLESERLHNQSLANELAQAKKDHSSQAELANNLSIKMDEITHEASLLESVLTASKALLEEKESELALLRNDKFVVEQHASALKQRHEDESYRATNLEGELSQTLQQLSEKEIAVENLSKDFEKSSQERDQLRNDLASHLSEKDLLQNNLADLIERKEILEGLLSMAQEALAIKENDFLAAQEAHSVSKELIDLHKEQYNNAHQKVGDLQNNLGSALQQLQEKEQSLQEAKEFTANESAERNRLAQELKDLATAHDAKAQEAELLQAHLSQLATDATHLEERLTNSQKLLEQRENDLVQARSDHQEVYSKLNEHSQLYNSEREKVDYLEKDLASNLKGLSELEQTISVLNDKLQHESATKDLLRQQLESISSAFQETKEEAHYLKEHITQLSVDATKLQDGLEDSHQLLVDKMDEVRRLETLLAKERNLLSQERQEKQFLREELTVAHDRLENLALRSDADAHQNSTVDR